MNLLRAAAMVSSLTLVSRITGLLRDVLIAKVFGASPLTDAFWVAFRIPNLFRRLFAEGAFSQAFVPILGEARSQRRDSEVRALLDSVATVMAWALLLLSVVGVLAAPVLVFVLGSGLMQSDSHELAVLMTRIMFPYIVCMSGVALASAILNTWRHFAIPAATPVLLNLAMIGASLWLAPRMDTPVLALAIGVMLGGVLQLAVQLAALRRLAYLPRLRLDPRPAWRHEGVQRVLQQMLPATLGVSVAQLSLIINTNIATWLEAGSVSWLSFADRLMEFPSALLGVALATVLLPSLSQAYAEGQSERYSSLLDWGLRLILLLGLPAMLGMALLAEGLVATLFHYGAFDARDVQKTSLAVMAYSAGLLGIMAVKVLAPGFYAKQDIRTPVRIAVLVLVVTQIMNLALVPWLGHAGLALSIGLGATLNAALLFAGLRRRGDYRPSPGWGRFGLRVLVALGVMGMAVWWIDQRLDWISLQARPWMRPLCLGAAVAAAVVSYFGVLMLLGERLGQLLRRR